VNDAYANLYLEELLIEAHRLNKHFSRFNSIKKHMSTFGDSTICEYLYKKHSIIALASHGFLATRMSSTLYKAAVQQILKNKRSEAWLGSRLRNIFPTRHVDASEGGRPPWQRNRSSRATFAPQPALRLAVATNPNSESEAPQSGRENFTAI
jgi:hypothetical protein